jgi:hypothetical protein
LASLRLGGSPLSETFSAACQPPPAPRLYPGGGPRRTRGGSWTGGEPWRPLPQTPQSEPGFLGSNPLGRTLADRAFGAHLMRAAAFCCKRARCAPQAPQAQRQAGASRIRAGAGGSTIANLRRLWWRCDDSSWTRLVRIAVFGCLDPLFFWVQIHDQCVQAAGAGFAPPVGT